MSCITFMELAEEWMQFQKNFVKESTHCTYVVQMKNHIIPLFGNMKCKELTSDIFQNEMLKWLENNRLKGNKPLSDKTVHDIMVILKLCIKYGIQKSYFSSPQICINLPVSKSKKKKFRHIMSESNKLL